MTRSFCRKASNFVDMVKFIGEYSGKIDDKGRMIFPSAFKNLLSDEGDMRFVVKKDIYEDCLEMYTFSEWERQSEVLKSKLNFLNRDHSAFWRKYMRDRAVVEPDSKLGRISIPKRLLESIGAEKEVVFPQDRNLGQGKVRNQWHFKRRIHLSRRNTVQFIMQEVGHV